MRPQAARLARAESLPKLATRLPPEVLPMARRALPLAQLVIQALLPAVSHVNPVWPGPRTAVAPSETVALLSLAQGMFLARERLPTAPPILCLVPPDTAARR